MLNQIKLSLEKSNMVIDEDILNIKQDPAVENT